LATPFLAKMKQSLVIKMEWDKFTCFMNYGEIVYQEDRPYMNTTQERFQNDIFIDWEKKPRSVRYSRFFKYLPERFQAYLTIRTEETRSRVKGIKKLLEKHTLYDIHSVLETEERFDRAPHELGYILEAKETTYIQKN
jgi:hypothetical protein